MSMLMNKVVIPNSLRKKVEQIKRKESAEPLEGERMISENSSIISNLEYRKEQKEDRLRVIIEARMEDNYPVEDYEVTEQLTNMIKEIGVDLRLESKTERYIFALLTANDIDTIKEALKENRGGLRGVLYRIWPDDEVKSMLCTSAKTVSADRARNEFVPDAGKDICWAVLDSGIDDTHLHFNNSSLAYQYKGGSTLLGKKDSTVILQESFLPGGMPGSQAHGTHVAAIIAGGYDGGSYFEDEEKEEDWRNNGSTVGNLKSTSFMGLAPFAKLVDLVVLEPSSGGDKDENSGFCSRVIQAIHQIRKWNNRAGQIIIHGANLSLGSQFKVEDFGCGQTPLCSEVDRLVESGVIVVTASGNEGFQRLRTKKERYTVDFQSHQDITITDPGNAELAITVGSTHRKRPLRHGVSFFSSRGPTADGRAKPEIIAPGEKILSANGGDHSTVQYVRKSGTSQAAPHVSGALACFLSKYTEYIGKPMLSKKILLETCWNINREKYFQGYGVLDVYRLLEMPSP